MCARPPLPKRKQSKDETFNWFLKPPSLPVTGDVYPDGSFLDFVAKETGRGGWAFAIYDDEGKLVAAAYGVPPPWIQGIEGAEAWATYQALLATVPGQSRYWPDCLPVRLAAQKGPAVARDRKNVLARIHWMMLTALEGVSPEVIGWMPFHLTVKNPRPKIRQGR